MRYTFYRCLTDHTDDGYAVTITHKINNQQEKQEEKEEEEEEKKTYTIQERWVVVLRWPFVRGGTGIMGGRAHTCARSRDSRKSS